MKKIQIKIHKSLTPELIANWQKLWKNSECANFFNSVEWFLVCRKTYKIKNYQIFSCYKDGELQAVFPTIKKRHFGIKAITSPGGKYIANAPLLTKDNDRKILRNLFNTMAENENLYLVEVSKPITNEFKKLYPETLASVISINYYIDLSTDPFRYLSKKQRRKIFNKVNKNIHRLNHKYFSKDNGISTQLNKVINIEQNSYKKLKSKDIFSREENERLYKNILEIAPHLVRIDYICNKDKPFVYSLGFIYSGIYLGMQTAYLTEYRKMIPGKVLLHFLLNDLRSKGYKKFDFGIGHSILKEEFSRDFDFKYDIYYSKSPIVRSWWTVINFARRVRIALIKSRTSKDGDFLFKRYNSGSKLNLLKRPLNIWEKNY